MNLKIANSMSGYIETLYYLNRNLLQLCGINVFYSGIGNFEKLILDIIQDIPRLIPFYCTKNMDKLFLSKNDGLLEYKEQLNFLENTYSNILNSNHDFLNKVRKIRNKYEHKMHDIKYNSYGHSNLPVFDVEFSVNQEIIPICSCEFIKLLKELNILFSKIVFEIIKFADNKGKSDHNYYYKISRFNFKEFNEIYDSPLLVKIGTIMNDY